ncbi:VWA domain-containing protein [Streptomyces sp. ME02-8801-2C]|uniref:vWA domain-containing protein n=1 Tax=Streptomyces sp. ME02-8801-2C TaxID=3028680 RepID=UPI0029A5AC18|nr:vWA domain-containing protein [Streptomyces sp. ME02-8801-2C]MDX3452465.1 VWA domain-containing protein [Streptomyces sp. ME02-8801-2C]
MPFPGVSQPTLDHYRIDNSKAFLANFDLDVDGGTATGFTITFPDTAPAAGLTVTLKPPPFTNNPDPAPVALWPVPNSPVVRGAYTITVSSEPATDPTALNVEIFNNAGDFNQTWELRAKVSAPIDWTLNYAIVGTTNMHYLASDPRAELQGTPATMREQEPITLHSADATQGTVIGTLPASLAPTYRWRHEHPIAISDLPSPVLTARDYDMKLPGVYEPQTIRLVTDVAFGGTTPNNTAFLTSTSDPNELTVSARPQHVVMVLDRSGSMALDSPSRWSRAVAAARVFTHLYAGAREHVHGDDSLAIVTFTDEQGWHGGSPSNLVKTIMPLTKISEAKDIIKTLNLEQPLSLTPIGDGLVRGVDLLADAGPVGDRRLTMLLVTDGEENAGCVYVGPDDPSVSAGLPPGTVKSFANLPFDPLHPRRGEILSWIREHKQLFAIGLGSQVETTVLGNLAAGTGHFLPVNTPADLASAFAQILNLNQDVDRPIPTVDAGMAHFTTTAGADRLIFAIVPKSPVPNTSIRLERLDPSTGQYDTYPVTPESTETHHVAWVSDLPNLTDAAIEWRVTYLDITDPLHPVPKPLTVEEVFPFEDLHVKADILLDKPAYLTGDDMKLTVRLRHDAAPILGATIRAELVAPAVGMGTALSGLGPNVRMEALSDRRDPPSQREARIEELLRRNKWHHLPCEEPPKGLFVDGTNELHDPDGDGNYTNTFARVNKEGAFSWTLFAEGVDTNGQPFSRQLTVAALAGIRVDVRKTEVEQTRVPSHPSGMRAVRVTVTPQDAHGGLLGPDKDRVVIWALENGIFEHVWKKEPAPVFTDGTYQRVVLFRAGQRPRLRVKASGTVLREIRIA